MQSNTRSSSNIFEKNLKQKVEIPISFFSFLFSEMIQYIYSKRSEDKEDFDLEAKLSCFGYSVVNYVLII